MQSLPSASNRVLLGLSGHALSSVVAALLKHQGFQVIGLHLKTTPASQAEAERVAQKLGIQLIVEDATGWVDEFVTDHVVHAVIANRQPEPTVVAHQKIIIERLCEKAKELNCGKISTGHAARVALDPSTGLTRLLRAIDADKDQSHLLFGIPSGDLAHFILPVGDLGAQAIERLAVELGLDSEKTAAPSVGFGVLSDQECINLAESRIPQTMKVAGQIKTSDGGVLGEHDGLYKYHRGQSKGLPLPREKGAEYVAIGFNSSTTTLIVGTEQELMTQEAVGSSVNWLRPMDPIRGLNCQARIKPGVVAPCRVTSFKHGFVHVEFAEPQRNIVSGQAIVFYAGDEVLGGAFAV